MAILLKREGKSFFFFFFKDTISYTPGWFLTHYAVEDDLELLTLLHLQWGLCSEEKSNPGLCAY